MQQFRAAEMSQVLTVRDAKNEKQKQKHRSCWVICEDGSSQPRGQDLVNNDVAGLMQAHLAPPVPQSHGSMCESSFQFYSRYKFMTSYQF